MAPAKVRPDFYSEFIKKLKECQGDYDKKAVLYEEYKCKEDKDQKIWTIKQLKMMIGNDKAAAKKRAKEVVDTKEEEMKTGDDNCPRRKGEEIGVKEEHLAVSSETPLMDCDDPRTVFRLLKARGLSDNEAWRGVGELMSQIQTTSKDKKLSVIAAYIPLVATGPGFVLGVLLEQEPATVVAAYLETFTGSLGPDMPDNKEEIFELFSRHRQLQDREAPALPIKEDERFPIPTRIQQLARCCALNMDLVDWCKMKYNNRQYDQSAIRKWFIEQPERLEGTGLTVEELSVDHIVPSCLGGISYVFNYALVPKRVNSKFRERFEDFKRAYLGKQTIEIAMGFAVWVRVRNDVLFSQFNVANFMINEPARQIRPKVDRTGLVGEECLTLKTGKGNE
jgi:hypothetical protein